MVKSGEGEDGSFPKTCSVFPRGEELDVCVVRTEGPPREQASGLGVPGSRSVGRSQRLVVMGTGSLIP